MATLIRMPTSPTPRPKRVPPFEVLAKALRDAITSGAIPVGAYLPSEPQLSRDHGVARETARRALDVLRQEGLIETAWGRGSKVIAAVPTGEVNNR